MSSTSLAAEQQMDAEIIKDTNAILQAGNGAYAGMTVRHVKTNRLYVVVHPQAILEATYTLAVVYKSARDGSIWVRPASEFYDGRFVGA